MTKQLYEKAISFQHFWRFEKEKKVTIKVTKGEEKKLSPLFLQHFEEKNWVLSILFYFLDDVVARNLSLPTDESFRLI